MSKSDIDLISTASSLHDIGKISISDDILNKPGRLTAEEFEVMKGHSAIGAQILSGLPLDQQESPLVKVASEICRWHHERYDGNGYPDGLKGEEIPISAQVVALADVYDALTSDRCYKKAYSHTEALKMILEGQCGAFNPVLLQCLQEIAGTLERELTEASGEKTVSIQDMRNKIDYDRLFSYEKYSSVSRKQQHLQLYIDSLTGVYNRRYYDEHFRRAEDTEAIAVMDVDDFKKINVHYGRDAGDIVLQRVVQAVLSCVQETDSVIRYGGDEFVIIFYSIPADTYEERLENIKDCISRIVIEEYPDMQVSASIGGAYGTAKTKKLFKIADGMMYEAKLTKNQVLIRFLDRETDNMKGGR